MAEGRLPHFGSQAEMSIIPPQPHTSLHGPSRGLKEKCGEQVQKAEEAHDARESRAAENRVAK
eukprot:563602-Amorphochlora_amoeboformis.AAC.2